MIFTQARPFAPWIFTCSVALSISFLDCSLSRMMQEMYSASLKMVKSDFFRMVVRLWRWSSNLRSGESFP